MAEQTQNPTPLQNIAGGVFGFSLVIAVLEMTPGWGFLGLDWPPAVFCIITAVLGAIAGWISRTGYRLPGVVAGAMAGPGAILAMHLVIRNAERVPAAILLVAALVGMLPAIGVYKALTAIQDVATPPRQKPRP
jgi:hypothetical protein